MYEQPLTLVSKEYNDDEGFESELSDNAYDDDPPTVLSRVLVVEIGDSLVTADHLFIDSL